MIRSSKRIFAVEKKRPRGLKPGTACVLYAALKGRSSTWLRLHVCSLKGRSFTWLPLHVRSLKGRSSTWLPLHVCSLKGLSSMVGGRGAACMRRGSHPNVAKNATLGWGTTASLGSKYWEIGKSWSGVLGLVLPPYNF